VQISDHSVKCQRCGNVVPIVGKLTKVSNDKIGMLQKRIKWIENYSRGNNKSSADDLKALKAELAELLEEDAKYDKLRSLPLYSCRITGFRFVCSKNILIIVTTIIITNH
jgi:hypothetical protein